MPFAQDVLGSVGFGVQFGATSMPFAQDVLGSVGFGVQFGATRCGLRRGLLCFEPTQSQCAAQ